MPDNIIIRKSNDTDLEEILTLINQVETDVMEARDARPVFQTIQEDPNYFQIVASAEQGLVGMATLVIIMQLTHEGGTTALITDIISKNNDQEVTTMLLNFATELAQEYGCYKVVLHSDFQAEQIQSSCQSLGYEQTPPGYQLPQ